MVKCTDHITFILWDIMFIRKGDILTSRVYIPMTLLTCDREIYCSTLGRVMCHHGFTRFPTADSGVVPRLDKYLILI